MRDVLATIAAVKADGRHRDTRCQAHDDHRASLSIGLGDDGRVLVHCHAGCTIDAILAAAHLEPRDLFPATATTTTRTIVATYPYHDEGGAHLFDVVRFAPKDFRQRRADGAWTMAGVRRVLFGLPALRQQKVVYVVEGEKDVLALRAIGLSATTNAGGAGKWRDAYAQQLTAAGIASIVILPDHDEPGRAHAETVARACHLAGQRVKIVALPDLPAKGDVTDWLDAGHTRDELIALVKSTALYEPSATAAHVPLPVSTAYTLADVEATFTRWIRDDDHIPTRAVLAAYIANRKLDGDPVWLMLVGGSGVGKTERLIPLAVMPDVVLESSITGPAALLSGTGKKERAKDATGGLLRKLPEGGGVLLLKDFTSIIDMHRDSRAEVLAALREVYDGRWDRSVGAEGGRTLTWTGHLGLLAGCTTAIDSAHSVMSVMGTRFLLVRLQGDRDIAGSAFDHVGRERLMRDELRAAVRGLLDHLPGAAYEKTEIRGEVIALASFVALARSPVDRDSQSEIRLVLDPEAPTRIVKMLTQLWRACGLLGLAKADAWKMVRRVGLDSIPKLRRAILDYLATCITAPTTTAVAEAVDHPGSTTRRGLEDLTAHRVVRRIAGGSGKADRWELTIQTRDWLEATLPVSSESTYSGSVAASASAPPIKTQITNDDITGKVGTERERTRV